MMIYLDHQLKQLDFGHTQEIFLIWVQFIQWNEINLLTRFDNALRNDPKFNMMIYPDRIQKCILTIFRIDNIITMHSQCSHSFWNFYWVKSDKFQIMIAILKMTGRNGHNYGMMISQAWKRNSCLPYLQRKVFTKGNVCIPQKFCREFYLGRSIKRYMVSLGNIRS